MFTYRGPDALLPDPQGVPVATVRITGSKDIELFKQLVNRAMNCWDTAPAELKEFADRVTEGRIQQNYVSFSNFEAPKL